MAKAHFKSRHTPKYKIKIDGVDVPAGLLCEAVVDQSTDMADMFMLDFFNDCCRLSDLNIVKPGNPVEVKLGYEEHGGKTDLVIAGEISVLKGNFPRKGPAALRVQGYTAFHKMVTVRKTRSFKKNKSYGDIAKLIAGEHQMGADVDATPTKYEYVFQRNQTDHEFLLELADRLGFEVYVRHQGTKAKPVLHFKKPNPAGAPDRVLSKGASLLAFNPRVRTALRPTAVQLLGWDPIKQFKESYGDAKGKGQAGPDMGGEEHAVDVSAKMKDAIDAISHYPLTHATSGAKDDELKAIAEARLQKRSLDFVEADAVCTGMADLSPGRVVEVDGVGDIFNGNYYVKRVIHDFMPTGFTTRLILRKASIQKKGEPPPPVKKVAPPAAKKAAPAKKLTWWQRIKRAVRRVVGQVARHVQRAVMPNLPAARPPAQAPAAIRALPAAPPPPAAMPRPPAPPAPPRAPAPPAPPALQGPMPGGPPPGGIAPGQHGGLMA